MTAETLWQLLGGKRWASSPLNAVVFRRLVRKADFFMSDRLVACSLANYKTEWQLALDCNLPGEERNEHKSLAITYGAMLENRLEYLSGVERPSVVPLVF